MGRVRKPIFLKTGMAFDGIDDSVSLSEIVRCPNCKRLKRVIKQLRIELAFQKGRHRKARGPRMI